MARRAFAPGKGSISGHLPTMLFRRSEDPERCARPRSLARAPRAQGRAIRRWRASKRRATHRRRRRATNAYSPRLPLLRGVSTRARRARGCARHPPCERRPIERGARADRARGLARPHRRFPRPQGSRSASRSDPRSTLLAFERESKVALRAPRSTRTERGRNASKFARSEEREPRQTLGEALLRSCRLPCKL